MRDPNPEKGEAVCPPSETADCPGWSVGLAELQVEAKGKSLRDTAVRSRDERRRNPEGLTMTQGQTTFGFKKIVRCDPHVPVFELEPGGRAN
jgi:hypothetical protein